MFTAIFAYLVAKHDLAPQALLGSMVFDMLTVALVTENLAKAAGCQ